MKMETKTAADVIVQSFAYKARQLAAQYEQILSEAEKHRSALRLVQRDAFEMAEQGLRQQTLTKAECHRLRVSAAQTIALAQQTINGIAAQYAPHKLAA